MFYPLPPLSDVLPAALLAVCAPRASDASPQMLSLTGLPGWWFFPTTSGVYLVTDSATARWGIEGVETSITGVSAMTRIFGLRNCRDEQQGWNHGHLHNGRGRVAGSTTPAVRLPAAAGATRLYTRCVRVACPNAARLAGTGGSATIAGGHHFHCFVLPAVLYGPGHLPLDTRCVGFSHNGVCGPEVPLLSYRCFTAYR